MAVTLSFALRFRLVSRALPDVLSASSKADADQDDISLAEAGGVAILV
jgi:hypothetical protein